MSALQITAIVLCLIVPTVGWVLLFRQAYRFTALFRAGAPDPTRRDRPGRRTATLLREFLGHTRMSRLPVVAIAHWFTALGFLVLFATLVNAFFQLVWPDFRLPIVGHFPPFEWLVELMAWGCLLGIIALIIIRQKNHPRSAAGEQGRRSRFFGSTWWHAYFVEIIILLVSICILSLRSQEAALVRLTEPETNLLLHFPLTAWLSPIWGGLSLEWLEESIIVVAMIKILVSFTWMITVSLTPTMGVAWHRFLAFFNIWFKRHADGRTSLGALQPMTVNGENVTAENLEELMEAAEGDEESDSEMAMGVGHVQDFTWKQLLDFSTCTECGRCQSQCPAWNTDKPLSPKLLMTTLRDHSHEMAPWLTAASGDRRDLPEHTLKLATMPLVGDTGYEQDRPLGAYDKLGPDAVIDSDVLWSCTTCGACVEQCPVDIEHVDAIVDMRRHQVLIESAFPAEFGGLFKNLESKQNPWGMAPKMRLDWAKGLEFDIPVVGADVEDLSEVDYLFWVGCAGAFEDRAKKTTRAVAELLHEADVSFAILGEGEACTGDAARRAGNEILYQMLAAQNVEVLNEAGAKKIVVTCAHCFNTLRNEYPQNGGRYEVLHHTQLLNRLVREKRLVPVSRPEDHPGLSSPKKVQSTAPSVTYHDPCYLGRHNDVYAPPRELIGALPGVELREMPRHGMKSFCCGAGGARMWAEENLGTRINLNRTAEAVETGADRIAIGCPFCRVMLSDGLTAMQSEGTARDEVEVVDVAQMLLAAVRRGESPDESTSLDVPSAGEFGTAAVAAPEDDVRAAKEEAAEGGGAEFDTSDDTARAAQEARAQEPEAAPAREAAPAAQETPTEGGAPTPATPKGKMSAADALAAMGAGAGTQAAEAPVAEQTPAPVQTSDDTPKAAVPKGKMSAADALAAMGGAAAGGATADERPAATPAPESKPTAGMPKGKMSAADALAAMSGAATAGGAAADDRPAAAPAAEPEPAPADDRPATTPVADSKPTPPAVETKPATMPKGKMSAADALAMLQGRAPAEPGGQADAAPATPDPTQQTPAAGAPAPQAPPPETPKAEAPTADAPTADAPKAEAPKAESPKAEAPEAAASTTVEMPTGTMSATEAMALLGGVAAQQPAAEDVAAVAVTDAASTEAPTVETTPEPETEDASASEVDETPAPEAEAASAPEAAPAPTPAPTPRPATPPAKAVQMPSGRMSATEALSLLGGMAASAPAEEPAPAEPPTSPVAEAPEPAVEAQAPIQDAPAAEAADAADTPVTEQPHTVETDPVEAEPIEAEPVEAEPVEAEPVETEAPIEDVPASAAAGAATDSAPASEAPAPQTAATAPKESGPTMSAGAAEAWQELRDAAGGKPIAASEALKILGGH